MLCSHDFRRALPAAILFLGTCQTLTVKAPPPRPNVVLISVDSLRADHLGCYGYPRLTSPNLDRIAREGALFENAIAESSWTLPTHVSMLTGLSSSVHGVELDFRRLAEEVPTLVSRLREAGYQTKGIYSGPYLHPLFGFGRGFDEYEGVYGDADGLGAEIAAAAGADDRRRANRLSHRTVTSPAVTERAIEYLRRGRDKPFFLFLHYFDVHYDYRPPESAWRRFDPDYDGKLSSDNFLRNSRIHPKMDPRELEHLIALYDGEIFFTDEHIGYLLDALDEAGLAGETLVVATADHGEEFFEHGRKGHRHTLHDEVLKVPLLARFPNRIPAGIRVGELVRHVDLTPTILSLVGIEIEAPASGTAISELTGRARPRAAALAVSRLAYAGGRLLISARTKEHKYLINLLTDRRREFLYDLTRDPREQDPIELQASPGPDGDGALARLRQTLAAVEVRERALRERFGDWAGENVEVPDEVREQLRSLGYVQ